MSVNIDLDDLGSFEGSDPAGSPRQTTQQFGQSPQSPRLPYYNPVGLTIGEISPSSPTRSILSDSSGFGRNHVHPVNAVHMHVQENARIPLFNQHVDRSNANRPTYAGQVANTNNNNSNNNNMAPDLGNYSMAELFLSKESKHRQSLNRNYERQGSLQDEGFIDNSRRPSIDSNNKAAAAAAVAEDETQMEIDALTAAIDPTPWSEIERKIHVLDPPTSQTTPKQTAPAATTSGQSHPHVFNYYPYGRQHQLPIPEKSQSPLQQQPNRAAGKSGQPLNMAQALATAAALASVGNNTTSAPKATSTVPPAGRSSIPSATTSFNKSPQNTGAKAAVGSGGHYPRQRATYSAPQHAVAHASSRASVLAAANQKSQYGFGGNHAVVSVPAPPPFSEKAKNDKKSTSPLPEVPNLQALHGHPVVNTGAAYERKKQRAKDARVKLNDAIERLSIAMSLAGSQSKQRNNVLNTRVGRTDQRAKSLQINDECVKLAEQAKKWDRPSFVATAASLVQTLNSQCDSLTREMVFLQERLDAATGSSSGVHGGVPPPPLNGDGATSHPDHKRQDHPLDAITEAVHHTTKRMRGITMNASPGEEGNAVQHVQVSPDDKAIYLGVAKMLDPVTLVRCPCVSRTWRDMAVFNNDDIWLNLAVKRFGFFNVRQWAERMEDGDMQDGDLSKKALYRAMNAANVMPHMYQDSLSLLGEAKIPGRVSGWVFMVERSNGETLRSVKREPGSTTPGNGTYQSRPVVELRIVIQNTGMASSQVVIRNQQISIDVSTRRSGGELGELFWDTRFAKVAKNLDGSKREIGNQPSRYDVQGDLCRLGLFEAVVVDVHINARGCSTTSKFQQRSNFTKLLVCLEGTTVPMVIPFLSDGSRQ